MQNPLQGNARGPHLRQTLSSCLRQTAQFGPATSCEVVDGIYAMRASSLRPSKTTFLHSHLLTCLPVSTFFFDMCAPSSPNRSAQPNLLPRELPFGQNLSNAPAHCLSLSPRGGGCERCIAAVGATLCEVSFPSSALRPKSSTHTRQQA